MLSQLKDAEDWNQPLLGKLIPPRLNAALPPQRRLSQPHSDRETSAGTEGHKQTCTVSQQRPAPPERASKKPQGLEAPSGLLGLGFTFPS